MYAEARRAGANDGKLPEPPTAWLRSIGALGGHARARTQTQEQLSEQARLASNKRWSPAQRFNTQLKRLQKTVKVQQFGDLPHYRIGPLELWPAEGRWMNCVTMQSGQIGDITLTELLKREVELAKQMREQLQQERDRQYERHQAFLAKFKTDVKRYKACMPESVLNWTEKQNT